MQWQECSIGYCYIGVSICIKTTELIPAEERRAKWIFDKTINSHEGTLENTGRNLHCHTAVKAGTVCVRLKKERENWEFLSNTSWARKLFL